MGVEFYVHFEREFSGDKIGSLKAPKAFVWAIDNFDRLAGEINVQPLGYFLFPPTLDDQEPIEIELGGTKFKFKMLPADPSSVYRRSKWVPAALGLKTVSPLLAELKRRKNNHFEKVVVSDLKLIEKKLKLADKQKIGFRFDIM